MIAKFLDEPVKEDMKETTALDYRYGTRIKDEKKQKVNIYELGTTILLPTNYKVFLLILMEMLILFVHDRWRAYPGRSS